MIGRWKNGRVGLFVVLCLSCRAGEAPRAIPELAVQSVLTRVALDMKLASGL